MAKLTFSEQLARFIEKDGRSRRQICLKAGLDPTQMHRFLHGTGKLTNETIDRLADAMELKLTKRGN